MLLSRRISGLVSLAARGRFLSKTQVPLQNNTPCFHFSKSSKMEFKAETKKLLDIVAKSLYTDSEVFIR